MQHINRRSSSLSEHSLLVGQEDREVRVSAGDSNSRKRTSTELAQSNEIEKSKRARGASSKSNGEDSEARDFIVVSSRPSGGHRGCGHEKDRSTIFTSPTTQVCSFGAGQESASSNLNETEKYSTASHRETREPIASGSSECKTSKASAPESASPETTDGGLPLSETYHSEGLESESLHNNDVKISSAPHQERLLAYVINDVGDHSSATRSTPSLVNDMPLGSTRISPTLVARSRIESESQEESAEIPKSFMSVKTFRTPLPIEKLDVGLTTRRVSLVSLGSNPEVVRSPKGLPSSSDRASSIAEKTSLEDSEATASLSSAEIQPAHPLSTGVYIEQRKDNAPGEWPMRIQTENLKTTAALSIQMMESSGSAEKASSRTPIQESAPFNTFPPKFQVNTIDSVKQQQSSPNGRWNRKKSSSEETLMIVPSSVKPQDAIYHPARPSTSGEPLNGTKTVSASSLQSAVISSNHGPLLLEPKSWTLPANAIGPPNAADSASNNDPLAATSQDTSLTRVQPPTQIFYPPAVKFTIDNRAESILPSAKVSALLASLSNNASVLVLPTSRSPPVAVKHPIGVIMWQILPGFYLWYFNATGSKVAGPLKFELMDVHWQAQKSFILPFDELNHFRELKQYIWDFYWVATRINPAVRPFRISIANYSEDTEALSSSSSQPARRNWNFENAHYQPLDQTSERDQLPQYLPHNSRSDIFAAVQKTHMPGQIQESHTASSTTNTLPPLMHHSSSKFIEVSPTTAGIVQSAQSPSDSVIWHSHRMPHQASVHSPSGSTGALQLQSSQPTSDPNAERGRTESDKLALRRKALQLLPHDMELLPEESSVFDKFPYKSGSQVSGAIVDKLSGKGFVSITGKGYITMNVWTGPDEVGDRYQQVNIHHKQSCMLHGGAVVLYYKRREASETAANPRSQAPDMKTPTLDDPLSARAASLYRDVMIEDISARNNKSSTSGPQQSLSTEILERSSTSSELLAEVDIVIRIQIERSGKFSIPYDKSFLRPGISVAEFFSWFATTSGYAKLPAALKFTFKDAMPAPTSTQISRGNEDHFKYLRKDIKTQCTNSKAFMPELKEFVVLITVPGWEDTSIEEDW